MCLVAVAVGCHPDYPLIVAGNRDELHARPAAPAQWWADAPEIFGGRDLQAGGSWLAVNRSGRFAVVTNQPAKSMPANTAPSRGALVTRFVSGGLPADRYVEQVGAQASAYAGFSLVVGDQHQAWLLREPCGDAPALIALSSGISIITNALPGENWPKGDYLQRGLGHLLQGERFDPDACFRLLEQREPVAKPADRPVLSTTPFVLQPGYGTRASTVLVIQRDGQCVMTERQFDATGRRAGESAAAFQLNPAGAA